MDRFDFYFLQLVSEAEIDGAFDRAELADQAIVSDTGLVGVVQGATVTQHAPTADLTVDVLTGTAYDPDGQRMRVPSLQVVDMSVDHLSQSTTVTSGGNTNILSLFLLFERSLSAPRIDGNSNQVFFQRDESFDFKVAQSGEAASPSPPALEADKILLADITLSFGTTQILNAAISTARRQDAFVMSAGALAVQTGTPEQSDQAILTHLNNHITSVANLHPATAIDYAGGPAWLGGVTNPATTVEAQLDKMVSDLGDVSATSGGDKIGGKALTSAQGTGLNLIAGSLTSQLQDIIDEFVPLSGDPTWTGDHDFNGNIDLAGNLAVDKAGAHVVTYAESVTGVDWSWTKVSGTGANAGVDFTFTCQDGQNQTGGADNNLGGGFAVELGRPGTGGSGEEARPGAFSLLPIGSSGSPLYKVVPQFNTEAVSAAATVTAHFVTRSGELANVGNLVKIKAHVLTKEVGGSTNVRTAEIAGTFEWTGATWGAVGSVVEIFNEGDIPSIAFDLVNNGDAIELEVSSSPVNVQVFSWFEVHRVNL